eukprot:SAG22_NODE_139_length_18025_cov_4.352058_6_plen_49_part_00
MVPSVSAWSFASELGIGFPLKTNPFYQKLSEPSAPFSELHSYVALRIN